MFLKDGTQEYIFDESKDIYRILEEHLGKEFAEYIMERITNTEKIDKYEDYLYRLSDRPSSMSVEISNTEHKSELENISDRLMKISYEVIEDNIT